MLKRNIVLALLSLSISASHIVPTQAVEMVEEIKASTIPSPSLKNDYDNVYLDKHYRHVAVNAVKQRKPGNNRVAPPAPKELTEEADELTQRAVLTDSFGLSKLILHF